MIIARLAVPRHDTSARWLHDVNRKILTDHFAWNGSRRTWQQDESRAKAAHDVKSLLIALAGRGIDARGFRDDVMLYAFLLSADPGGCSAEAVAERNLDRKLGASAEQHADFTLELAAKLRGQIESRGLARLYAEIDLPLTAVLARMEGAGIRIEPAALRALSGRMDAGLQRLTAQIRSLAGLRSASRRIGAAFEAGETGNGGRIQARRASTGGHRHGG